MVQVRYKGQNYIMFGSRKIVNGFNEIPDEEFYKLMSHPSFASRVRTHVFEIPSDFPLVKPKKVSAKTEAKAKPVDGSEDPQENDEHEEEEVPTDRLSTKQSLKVIQKSEDLEYLQGLIDTDDRQKVKDAAQKRLDSLQSEENK